MADRFEPEDVVFFVDQKWGSPHLSFGPYRVIKSFSVDAILIEHLNGIPFRRGITVQDDQRKTAAFMSCHFRKDEFLTAVRAAALSTNNQDKTKEKSAE